jgi:hypothetical protein
MKTLIKYIPLEKRRLLSRCEMEVLVKTGDGVEKQINLGGLDLLCFTQDNRN